MAVPNMRRTMRGWTKKREGWLISQNIQDGEKNEFYIPITLECNIQPMPEEQIKRKPEEYWSWEWFSIIDISGNALTTDDALIIEGVRYRIGKKSNWKRSGFYKYEAVADYDYPIPAHLLK